MSREFEVFDKPYLSLALSHWFSRHCEELQAKPSQ